MLKYKSTCRIIACISAISRNAVTIFYVYQVHPLVSSFLRFPVPVLSAFTLYSWSIPYAAFQHLHADI